GFRCIKTLDGFYHQQRRRQRSSKSGRQARTSSGSQQLFPFPFQNMSPTRDKCSYIRPYLNNRPLRSQEQPPTETQPPSAQLTNPQQPPEPTICSLPLSEYVPNER